MRDMYAGMFGNIYACDLQEASATKAITLVDNCIKLQRHIYFNGF